MIDIILSNKALKAKEKTEMLCKQVVSEIISVEEVILFAENAKDTQKATCIEAIEFVTKSNPNVATRKIFEFAIQNLASKAPRVKWESAKVIGNTASLFPELLEAAINGLLKNSEHEGTVVRWSAAFALGEIFKLKTKFNKDLAMIFDGLIEREEKNSIKKIYMAALKNSIRYRVSSSG